MNKSTYQIADSRLREPSNYSFDSIFSIICIAIIATNATAATAPFFSAILPKTSIIIFFLFSE